MESSASTAIPAHHPSQPTAFSRTRNAFDMISSGGIGHAPDSDSESSLSPISDVNAEVNRALSAYERQFIPSGPRSLSGIALRSCLLGITFASSLFLTIYVLLTTTSSIWRATLFLAFLSLFHFLEFLTTATYNTHEARVSSFLLSSNGMPYTLAMISAFLECTIISTFFPTRQLLPPPLSAFLLILGLFLVIIMQCIRTLAIITAGPSFNHIVQHTHKSSHTLIQHGIYAYLRHPSYFGYFWWGLGTQLMLGNAVCFFLYAVALWKFFASRIPGEEKGLVRFFGEDYERYRKRTPVGIPFVR
jgi:protein-S-isoprenylcysteine O-methyltransferase